MAKKKRGTRPGRDRGRREVGDKDLKPLVVFAVEGETERAYVKALIANRYGDRIAFKFAPTGDQSSLTNLVSSIELKIRREGAGVKGAWIVCDRDENAHHRKQLDNWCAESEQHHAAISCPCIEYWFILHIKPNSSSHDARHAVKELDKAWPGGKKYKKGGQVPPELINATDEAVCRAHQRRKSLGGGADAWNSLQWTDMPELIAWLDELDPGETRH